MKALDRSLQRQRILQAKPWIPDRARLLDIGCADGAAFRLLPFHQGVGLDPTLESSTATDRFRLLRGHFPTDLTLPGPSDAILALAVLEHFPRRDQPAFAQAAAERLAPHGRLILTVPSPAVDRILAVLIHLRLADGMEAGQHFGFDPAEVPPLFATVSLTLRHHHRFQLGLNHLFVFEKT